MSDEIEDKIEELSEVEIALTDATKTILEILLQAFPNSEKYLTRAFQHQRNEKIRTKQPKAAAVFELLRVFVADPNRQANREEVRKILEEPPKGRA